MFTWEDNFRSKRLDRRHLSSLAAIMSEVRNATPQLAYKSGLSREGFCLWQQQVKVKLRELMQFPAWTVQPEPVCLSTEPRDGYRLEKWEFYPDSFSAVPVLMLIPEEASANHPVPGVLCFPGSAHSKELLAGEAGFSHPNCSSRRGFPERNAQALHIVRAGMVAVAFDNPGTAELAEFNPPDKETQWGTREALVNGLMNFGYNYLGWSVFQKLRFLEWFRELPYVDSSRLGCCGHSLGSEVEMVLGLLCDEIKVMVHNDFLCDPQVRYAAVTNLEKITNGGIWHYVPGFWRWFGFSDLLAAAAPKFLTINEGGADEFTGKVRDAYQVMGAPERFQVVYYPKFSEEASRKNRDAIVPRENLSQSEFYEDYSYVDVPDHSFRPEPSLRWLKKGFGMLE
ncbi:MAG TPA: alpha/beta hydrolase family protein [Lentisphaeria bacterium]|nr:alpha/beta hydrolase family protein [Lentisphaeria bacterium]